MTLGANPSFNAVCRCGEEFNHQTQKAESQVSHKSVIYMEGAGDGGPGVLRAGAGGWKDLKPSLLQVLYQIAGNDTVSISDTSWRDFPLPRKAGTPHFASPCGNKIFGASQGWEPCSGNHYPPTEHRTVDGDPASSSVQWTSQLICTGPEQSPTLS